MSGRPVAPAAPLDGVFVEMLAELRANRQLLERQRPESSTLGRADRDRLPRLLPVLGATFGSEMWTAREALAHESVDLRLLTSGLSARALGGLCKPAANISIAGLCVTAEAEEAGATLWSVKRCF